MIDSLKRNKNIISLVSLIYFQSFLVFSFLIPHNQYFFNLGNEIFYNFKSQILSEVNLKALNSFNLYLLILSNNLKVCLLSYISGFFNIFILLINSFILSYVLVKFGIKKFVIFVLPHGVIEIPAFILAISSGIIFYIGVIEYLRKKSLERVIDSLRILSLSIILFIIAGFIESFITFRIIPH
ncbi:stage II sporulation protein M [Methanocaldococcus infernus]